MSTKFLARLALTATTGLCFAMAVASIFSAPSAFAHPGGHGDVAAPIDAEQATYNAQSVKEMLVSSKKLDQSWLDVKRESGTAEKRGKSGDTDAEWVVTFSNAKEKDSKKNVLFIFLSLTGAFVAANHTGK